jgi:hypothetical protein
MGKFLPRLQPLPHGIQVHLKTYRLAFVSMPPSSGAQAEMSKTLTGHKTTAPEPVKPDTFFVPLVTSLVINFHKRS